MPIELSMSFVWGLLKDLVGVGQRIFGNEKHKEKIQHRLKWKSQFEGHSKDLDKMNVIIRHINRTDTYPETDDGGKGISSWFKTEYWGIYHRGIEVVIGSDSLCKGACAKDWTVCRDPHHEPAFSLVVGRIPFDVITEVDWNGDEYYPVPHIYCEFPRHQSKQPYERIAFCLPHKGGYKDWLEDIGDYNTLVKRSKKVRKRA